jgi:signal transduction histidine kinase
MFRVLGCIFQQHDLRLVVLAALLCLLATTTAMSMMSRARAAEGRAAQLWLATGGAVAGCGIWGLHFVAMLAYGAGLPVAYDPFLTILSALVAISLGAVGFLLVQEQGALLGGAVIGTAISAMHYTGMAAVRIAARARWDMEYVAASILIGVAVTVAAFFVAQKRNDTRGYIAGAGLFLVAIVSLHFTAMAAVLYIPNPLVAMPETLLMPGMLAIAVAAVVALIMGAGLIGALVDRHLAGRASEEASRMRAHIAELEATRAQLSVALEGAEAAGKAKAAFLATMGHELRTPLNAVIGFSEVMLAERFGALSPRYKDYIGDIRDSGARLLGIINDILDISRFETGRAELVEEIFDPADKLGEVTRIMAGQAEEGRVALVCDVAPELPLLKADRGRIGQILLNLISNALKFTPAGGTVTVGAALGAGGLELSVRDDGIGIAPGDMAKALEPFGQVDSSLGRKYEGTGLGLPLTRQMAALHGGSLKLDSVQGGGTRVTVILPASRLVPRAEAAA